MPKSANQLEMDIAEFLALGGRVVEEPTLRATTPAPAAGARRAARRTAPSTPTRSTASRHKDDEPVVLIREGELRPGHPWRQYLVVSDERVAVVHMEQALFGGWRFQRVDVQGKDAWPRMSRDDIVAWKFRADDGRTRVAEGLGEFRTRLLEVARAGRV